MYTRILVALDGSAAADAAGVCARSLAKSGGAEILACHVYGADLHGQRFREMEPTLPERYQEEESLRDLRESHDSLIVDGFRALSSGYMDAFLAETAREGTAVRAVVVEGRNYVCIVDAARERKADLIALGAEGLGSVGDGLLGSTAARVLLHAPCDVLVARPGPAEGPVVVGIDGSDHALEALQRGMDIARALNRPLCLAAAYDPYFHTQVFRAMAQSLSAERQEQVGLAKQDDLHKDIIDDGLGKLYQGFLEDAGSRLRAAGVTADAVLLKGKAPQALVKHAEETKAALLVVGRFGHHREPLSLIGSNADAAVRLARTNVLVTAPGCPPARGAEGNTPAEFREPAAVDTPGSLPLVGRAGEGGCPAGATETPPVEWDAEPLARLERIPAFARAMARRGIEARVRAAGGTRVTMAFYMEVARTMGMGAGAEEPPEPGGE